MKHLSKIVAFVVVIFLSQNSFGQGLALSKHDFSGQSWLTTNKLCGACHTPHNALSASDGALWDHQSTGNTFTAYGDPSGTINAVDLDNTLGNSKMCLSCHDGSVNLGHIGGVDNGGGTIAAAAQVGAGGDLSGDHPVGFTYGSALDGGLEDPSSHISSLGGTIQDDFMGGSDQMECATCHEVHNDSGNTKMLRVENTNSGLCLECHKK